MTTHVMIDNETLDTKPGAVILTVGAVKFDPYREDFAPHSKTLWRLCIESQLEAGRTVSDSTLEWWGGQPEDIREMSFSGERISLPDFFSELNRYLVGVDKIWCHGPQFDMVMIENLFEQFDHHQNWKYWQVMDSRTLFNLMPKDPRKSVQQNLHSADDDAYWQAVCVQKAYTHFEIGEKS